MTAVALALPYYRVSPLYLPRRDLVAAANDSLSLSVTVIESDEPHAILIDLATGPTFPIFTLTIWQDGTSQRWDYGGFMSQAATVLWDEPGTISVTLPGTVEFTVPAASLLAFPMRCGWAVRMDHDDTLSETLMVGALHVRGGRPGFSSAFLLDSPRTGLLG